MYHDLLEATGTVREKKNNNDIRFGRNTETGRKYVLKISE